VPTCGHTEDDDQISQADISAACSSGTEDCESDQASELADDDEYETAHEDDRGSEARIFSAASPPPRGSNCDTDLKSFGLSSREYYGETGVGQARGKVNEVEHAGSFSNRQAWIWLCAMLSPIFVVLQRLDFLWLSSLRMDSALVSGA